VDTEKIVFISFAIILLLSGLLTMFAGQYYLLRKIKKWNLMKAYLCILPFLLFLFLRFDNQVKIICRNYPKHRVYFQSGLLITFLGIIVFFTSEYVLN